MSSAKKQDNDYEIVTDQLDDDEEKQSEEKKLSVAQKAEANAAQQKSAAPQKPAAAVEEAEQKKQAELAKKKEAEAKAAAEKKEAEARAAAEKKAQEEKKKAQEQKEIEQAARNELKHMEEKKAGLNIEVDQLDDSFLDDPAPKEEKLVVKAKQSLPEIKNTADPKKKDEKKDEKKKEEKKKNVLKTAGKDYKIEVSGIDEEDRSKYVTELKVEKSAPEPGAERKKADELKKKFEAEPKPEDQKKLEQKKPTAGPEFQIEVDTFDDADVAEHVKSDEKKLAKKEDKEKKGEVATERKAGDAIKSSKDYNEAIIQGIRDTDSSLRIEVSKLNDEDIDEQIESHKETLKIAELRRKSADDAAKRIQDEDDADKKKAETSMAEKE